jgi:hypothetical protein
VTPPTQLPKSKSLAPLLRCLCFAPSFGGLWAPCQSPRFYSKESPPSAALFQAAAADLPQLAPPRCGCTHRVTCNFTPYCEIPPNPKRTAAKTAQPAPTRCNAQQPTLLDCAFVVLGLAASDSAFGSSPHCINHTNHLLQMSSSAGGTVCVTSVTAAAQALTPAPLDAGSWAAPLTPQCGGMLLFSA